MKFDKSKILTVVTADQARVGQKGWFAVLPQYIQENMSGGREPSVLSNIDLDSPSPFTREGGYAWPLFYPAPEPAYAERQAEWIKGNNVKEGTKVRVTRTFTEDEDGSWCWEHNDLVGMTGSVAKYGICSHHLGVTMSDGRVRVIPYFALEVIKEPTYEERQAEWIKENNVKVGTKVRFTKGFNTAEDGSGCCEHRDAKGKEGVVNEISYTYLSVAVVGGDYHGWVCPFTALEVIEVPTYRMTQVCVTGYLYNAQQLLELFVLDGKPCGIKEEK